MACRGHPSELFVGERHLVSSSKRTKNNPVTTCNAYVWGKAEIVNEFIRHHFWVCTAKPMAQMLLILAYNQGWFVTTLSCWPPRDCFQKSSTINESADQLPPQGRLPHCSPSLFTSLFTCWLQGKALSQSIWDTQLHFYGVFSWFL